MIGGLWGQAVIGLVLGAIWSPCVGPTLGAASVLAAQGRDLGAVAAVMMVNWKVDPFLAGIACLALGAIIGGAQGYFVAYYKIPAFIVTLAGMLVFKGLALTVLGGASVGPFPKVFQLLSSGYVPDIFNFTLNGAPFNLLALLVLMEPTE